MLAFFLKAESNPNKKSFKQDNDSRIIQWNKYFNATQGLIKENDSITIDLNLSLLMGNNLIDFWRYNGSLTIPPCTENVIWTVFKQPIYVYNYEFEGFRHDLLFESYRGPQPLFLRNIYRSFQHETLSPIPDQNCCFNMKSKGNFIFFKNNSIYFYLFYIMFLSTFI